MAMKFTNNAASTLAANVLIGDTSFSVATGQGALFPSLGVGDFFYCTLANTGGAIEIIKVTARTGDAFTVTRGQDGTAAQAWSSGDKVELRLVAASLNDIPKLDEANTFTVAQTFSASPIFSTINGIVKANGASPAAAAVAGDFPTLNQNTTGSAASLTTARTIDGVSFNGTTNITVIAPGTNAATSKTTPADADEFPITDSAAAFVLKKVTFTNLKAFLKTYFDTLYTSLATVISTVNTWTKAQIGNVTALTVSANAIAVDLSLSNNFSVTLQATTAQTLSNPTNAVAGQSGQIAITQNATPSTLSFAANWIPFDGVTPSVSTTASAQNLLSYYVVDSTHVWYSLNKHGVA